MSFLEAFQITGEAIFRDEVVRILDYVLRDMTDPEGGFYSAEDADSAPDPEKPTHKTEGAFYIWDAAEIGDRYFAFQYGVEPGGNVQNDPHGEFTGRNILFQAHTTEETAHHFDVAEEEVSASIDHIKSRLFEERSRRLRPYRDDKVLTAWNGMMIRAFARAGAVLDEAKYLNAARRAENFVRTKLMPEGLLLRRYREGSAAVSAFLDDYAALIEALLELYQCTFQAADLQLAVELATRQSELFEDKEQGGFFSTAEGASDLVMRMKEDYDGAEPGANAVTAGNLLMLARFTGEERYADSARRIFHVFASRINQSPYAVPQMLAAYQYSLTAPREVRFSGDPQSPEARPLLRTYFEKFLPLYTIAPVEGGEIPSVTVCQNLVCQLPTNDIDRFRQLLQ